MKKLTDEKKDALAAQYAAESTLRRLHANLKDDDSLPIESFIAPLEAEIKMHKNEVSLWKNMINFKSYYKVIVIYLHVLRENFLAILAIPDCSITGGQEGNGTPQQIKRGSSA